MKEATNPISINTTISGSNSMDWVAESKPKIPLTVIYWGVYYLI